MFNIVQESHQSPKMLIADDDPAIVRLLADRCSKMGFDVETATNGIQALIKANRRPPDILVVDINMPEVDGLSVCERLLDPCRRPLNIVVVTGRRDSETVDRCDSYGAFYVKKDHDFWTSLASALAETFPNLAERIVELGVRPNCNEVRDHPRVLVIDDDLDTGAFLSSRLGKHGVEMLFAEDTVHGYRIACRDEPSVIIVNYFMKSGDANYLLSRLRQTSTTERIPVIVWSERQIDLPTQQSLMREICGRPGAARILQKTYEADEIFEVLHKYCGFDSVAHPRIMELKAAG